MKDLTLEKLVNGLDKDIADLLNILPGEYDNIPETCNIVAGIQLLLHHIENNNT